MCIRDRTTGGTGTSLGCNPTTDQINGALGTATATDACSTPTTTPNDGPVTSDGCSRSQTRTWTSRDACGNTSTAARTVTWTSDNTCLLYTSDATDKRPSVDLGGRRIIKNNST